MAEINGFIKFDRELPSKELSTERVTHWKEFYQEDNTGLVDKQSARCMDCGVPFCHSGCPLGNLIPDFNRAVQLGKWKSAYDILSTTNNFPEFTGRICPAPCEASCVLNINSDPVSIEFIEKSIIEKAYEEGWVIPNKDIQRNGIKVAVIGSGPAGMAAADQLNNLGYEIDLYERNDKIGGLLRYGIPDFKLEKSVIDRRVNVMKSAGVNMLPSMNVGYDILGSEMLDRYDALVLSGGATVARDLPIRGRQLKGVHYAMDFLEENNRMVSGEVISKDRIVNVKDKNVIVIGGGDTGADCVGTSNRLRARSVTQIELLAKPPANRKEDDLWPNWPMVIRTSSSHEEGCDRQWAILTKRFVSEDGVNLSGIELVDIEWKPGEDGKNTIIEVAGSKRIIPCDVAFLAIGFLHAQKEGLIDQLGVKLDKRGNVKAQNYKTSIPNIYAAGDMRRGQSLVVWAIAEGRSAAESLHNDFGEVELSQETSVLSV